MSKPSFIERSLRRIAVNRLFVPLILFALLAACSFNLLRQHLEELAAVRDIHSAVEAEFAYYEGVKHVRLQGDASYIDTQFIEIGKDTVYLTSNYYVVREAGDGFLLLRLPPEYRMHAGSGYANIPMEGELTVQTPEGDKILDKVADQMAASFGITRDEVFQNYLSPVFVKIGETVPPPGMWTKLCFALTAASLVWLLVNLVFLIFPKTHPDYQRLQILGPPDEIAAQIQREFESGEIIAESETGTVFQTYIVGIGGGVAVQATDDLAWAHAACKNSNSAVPDSLLLYFGSGAKPVTLFTGADACCSLLAAIGEKFGIPTSPDDVLKSLYPSNMDEFHKRLAEKYRELGLYNKNGGGSMSYTFPENLYTDVRIEHVFSTNIVYTFRELTECRVKEYDAAFIRVFDGNRWYYGSTSDIENGVQAQIDSLARLAAPNQNLAESKIYKNLSAAVDELQVYQDDSVSKIPLDDKLALLQSTMPFLEAERSIKLWNVKYVDEYKVKEFYSSKGADLKFDYQRCGFSCVFQMADGDRHFTEASQRGKTLFSELADFEAELTERIDESRNYLLNSVAIEPGAYTVILAPLVSGIFAHECFGHKSESDFMVGDEETKKEWALGKKLGFDELSIIDSGRTPGPGYIPYDDEGNPASETYLVKNGELAGRLHNSVSASDLDEPPTGNGRSISYEYEPIVRMTTTYIDKGSKTREQLISETENGIYVKNLAHGSGMSTFTLAPTLAYYIRGGKIAEPVRISVITGDVFGVLSDIDGISDTVEFSSFVTGGCGKMEQYPLPVGTGGPYVRVRNLNVQ